MHRLCLILILFLGVAGCGDTYESSIPNVSFYFACSLKQAPYYEIETPGNFLKVEKNVNGLPVGYAGLIIGKTVYAEGEQYIAFDAACPVEASRKTSINVIADGLGKAVCPVCATEYNLSSGGFPTGKGTEYLKRYTVTLTGTTLQIRN